VIEQVAGIEHNGFDLNGDGVIDAADVVLGE
jgi:hypothetical protein